MLHSTTAFAEGLLHLVDRGLPGPLRRDGRAPDLGVLPAPVVRVRMGRLSGAPPPREHHRMPGGLPAPELPPVLRQSHQGAEHRQLQVLPRARPLPAQAEGGAVLHLGGRLRGAGPLQRHRADRPQRPEERLPQSAHLGGGGGAIRRTGQGAAAGRPGRGPRIRGSVGVAEERPGGCQHRHGPGRQQRQHRRGEGVAAFFRLLH
mmetsp:Transcript_4168/g.11190  ORF Transcript_4168/g.11190 Transcript_4168/m.11190 type:complete len:204 (+) Transcript_4168:410-1021(+)